MIQTRRIFIVASLVAASFAFATKDGVTLRKTITAGMESYHLEAVGKTTMTIPGSGDQEMGITSLTSYKYKIGAVDATSGTAPVELTSKVEKFDVDGPMAAIMEGQKDKILITTTSNGKLDDHNRFTADPSKKADPRALINGSAAYSFVGPYFAFPDKAVNPGDTWEITVPKSPFLGKEDQKLTAKFEGEKDGGYAISLSGSLKMNVNLGEILKDNPMPELDAIGAVNMTIKSTLDLTGDVMVSKTTGQTLSMTIKLASKQTAELPDQNISIPSTGTTTIKVTLDK